MDVVPKSFQLVYERAVVEARIEELGAEIGRYAEHVWKDSHTDILAIPILRGGMFFFSHLAQAVQHSLEIAPARAWGYQGNSIATDLKLSLADVPAKGRVVLLVDDICDSGRTLAELKTTLLQGGAREVRSAVLVKRKLAQASIEPDWVGFTYQGNEWLVGWGMDDNERFRNLRTIYAIRPPLHGRIGAHGVQGAKV